MKNTQKLLSLLLVLAMLFAMAPAAVTVSAEEIASGETIPAEETPSEETTTAASGEVDSYDAGIPTLTGSSEIPFRLNPLYEGILDADHFPEADFSHMQGDTSAVQSDYVSATDAAAQIRNNMLNRVSYYTVSICSASDDAWGLFDSVLAEAMVHNGNPKEGDSLQWQYGGYDGECSYSYSYSTYYYTFDIYMPYYTTYAQEVELDAAVANLLNQLNLWEKTDYEKVCAVYDYICDTVEYDYEHLNDDFYDLQYTAYAALVNEIAVCQGYSVLFYRLMLELGVDARVIVGDGGGPHAWNIVELDNLYYNLDSTWDAGAASYSYFLQSPLDFTGHTREPEYETAEFHAAYPMSPTSYGREPVVIEATPITTDTWYTTRIDTPDTVVYYSFTPAESGYYTLIADSNGSDTRCSLYNAGWSVIGSNDDSNDSYDFSLTAWLDAGQTYYYGVDYYGDNTGSFEILLTKEEGGSSGSDEIYALTLDVPATVTIAVGGGHGCYSFTPEYTGFYCLTAMSGEDTLCELYTVSGEYLNGDDDSGEGLNFSLQAYLQAGQTYYFDVYYYDPGLTGSFQILLTEADGLTESGKVENNIAAFYAVSDLTLGDDGVYRTPEGGTVYIGVDNVGDGGLTWLSGNTLHEYVDLYGSEAFDLTHWDALVALMDADGYVLLTPTTLQYLITTITGNPVWQETEADVARYLFHDPAPKDSDILAGDVNGDGEIDILDANLVVAWYNEIRDLDDDQLLAADVNRDGEVDIMDANMIVAYYNEIIDAFPVG